MIWFILAAIVVVVVIICVQQKKAPDKNRDPSNHNPMDIGNSNTTQKESLSDQDIYTCITRFCHAVQCIRDNAPYRDSFQCGMIEITENANGTLNIIGTYTHESKVGVYSALENNGFLSYMGMSWNQESERVFYNIKGIESQQRFDLDRLLASMKNSVQTIDPNVVIDHAWCKENTSYIHFTFPV